MFRIGVFVTVGEGTDVAAEFEKVRALEMDCCQICFWTGALYTAETAERVCGASERTGVLVTNVWAGWDGPKEWNFYGGPGTLGLVPPAYRLDRLRTLFAASDFAQMLGVTDISTHVGFLPENPNDPDYVGVLSAIRSLADYMKPRGQHFLFETGQETPITLLRAIADLGRDNVGVNFDTANLLLYGKANSGDALELLVDHVRNTHIKDGVYPESGRALGREVPFGEGRADFPRIVGILKRANYQGPLIIEREITGEQQTADIIKARDGLRALINA